MEQSKQLKQSTVERCQMHQTENNIVNDVIESFNEYEHQTEEITMIEDALGQTIVESAIFYDNDMRVTAQFDIRRQQYVIYMFVAGAAVIKTYDPRVLRPMLDVMCYSSAEPENND